MTGNLLLQHFAADGWLLMVINASAGVKVEKMSCLIILKMKKQPNDRRG